MAKITKFNFPFSGVIGKFGNTDASRGRDPGIAVIATERKGTTHLIAAKARSHPRTPAVNARSTIYCDCDCGWKDFPDARRKHIVPWWDWARGYHKTRLPAYQTYMSACLRSAPEIPLFRQFCWAGRYELKNDTTSVIPAHNIQLTGIPTATPDGEDNEVWISTPQSHLLQQVNRSVVTPGTIQFATPGLFPGGIHRWCIYAYTTA